MKIALLVVWNIEKSKNTYFVPKTHYSYLEYLNAVCEKIILITTVREVEKESYINKLNFLSSVVVVELPVFGRFYKALGLWNKYYHALALLKGKIDFIYCRVPDPYSWMPRLLFGYKTVMHFVGDAIEATKNDEQRSWFQKIVMIGGYFPDYCLTLLAARKSRVCVNGFHLVKRLKKYGISPLPVISSTIAKKSLSGELISLPIENDKACVHITYVGYIRYAKGMHCLLNFCKELNERCLSFKFHLVGGGEMENEVKKFIQKNGLVTKIILYGHIDNIDEMNKILRSSDLFFFPSLSEGSPRVVIEAMAQGVPVISTPVGSLPTTFVNKESIRFFDFDAYQEAVKIVEEYIQNPQAFIVQRENAYKLIKENYTIESFLSTVFKYEA